MPFLQGRQLVFPAHQVPTENGSTLKGKRFLTSGASSFPLKKIPSQKEDNTILIENATSDQDLLCSHETHDNYKTNNQPPLLLETDRSK